MLIFGQANSWALQAGSGKRQKLNRRVDSQSGTSRSSISHSGISHSRTSHSSISHSSTKTGSVDFGASFSDDSSTDSDNTINSVPPIHSDTATENGGSRLYTDIRAIEKIPSAYRRAPYRFVGRQYYDLYKIQCSQRQWVLNCRCTREGRVQCRGFRRKHPGRPEPEWPIYDEHSATAVSQNICDCMHHHVGPWRPPTPPLRTQPPRSSRKVRLSGMSSMFYEADSCKKAISGSDGATSKSQKLVPRVDRGSEVL